VSLSRAYNKTPKRFWRNAEYKYSDKNTVRMAKMKENTYPRKSGKIDIFGDEIWIFTPEAESYPDYSITFNSIKEWEKWKSNNGGVKSGILKSILDGINWLITG